MKLTRKQWMMLVVLVLGAFVTVLNQTLVTPALPSIMTEMNVDQSTAQWLTTGFTLVNAIMIPITAFLQDRFSTRKLFVFSMSLFAVGTLLAAVGLNFPVLLGGRLVQAAGAGILMPVTMTVLMLVFPVDRRGSAMGIFGSGFAWLAADGRGRLSILALANQDNPLSYGFYPILPLDVWEHAYYLKYQNLRGNYIDNWFQVANWTKAAGRLSASGLHLL